MYISYKPPASGQWGNESDFCGMKYALSYCLDSFCTSKNDKGAYRRVADRDEDEDDNVEDEDGVLEEGLWGGVSRKSSPNGYGTTFEEASNPFVEA